MNETNRSIIVLAAAVWIILMAVVIFVAWAAPEDATDRVKDFAQYLDEHRDDAYRLILTLGALLTVVLALLVIIVELAPEEAERELKVEQAGATTIVPAEALRARLEEALLALPQVTAARARVFTRDNGIASSLDLTITPDANVAVVTQDAARVVADTLQTELGLPAAGVPTVRVVFGGPKVEPVASSVVRPPIVGETAAPGEGTTPATGEAAPAVVPPEPPSAEEAAGDQPQP